MVFYRKYRPQKIEDLDSKEVRDLLYSVLSSKDIAHAFLFTGPKGLGKTSSARIVAKAVNCLSRQTINKELGTKDKKQQGKEVLSSKSKVLGAESIEPCNECYQCTSITNGTNIDVLEIDGASNRGIDEIRDLREKIRLAPAGAHKKVYIIDEVHMLTTEAFNALLKTLEEPPSHVIFILCTTEPHKVPATIVSRCIHVSFKKATTEELVRSFQRIADKEKLIIDKEALDFIASLSDGSFRDGSKILEEMQLVSGGEKITKELVQKRYQIRHLADQISKMIECLSKKDTKGGLQLVSKMMDQGVDMKYFLEQLIGELHEMLLVQVGIDGSSKLKVLASFPIGRSGQSSKLSVEEIKGLVELFSRAYGELKYAVLSQLPLEMAIVEWGLQQAQKNAEPHSEQRGNEIQRSSAPAPPNRSVSRVRIVPGGERQDSVGSNSALFSDKTVQAKNKMSDSEKFWNELINKVKLYNHSIAGVLRGCTLKSYDSKKIVIEASYKFHKERLEEKKTGEIIEKVCGEIAGNTIGVSVVLKGGE